VAAALDPTFAEAHNKLAALHHQKLAYDKCLHHAKVILIFLFML